MRGFLGPKATGFLEQLQKLELATRVVWSQTSTQCYKFGTKPIAVPAAACYSAAAKPGFFQLPHNEDFTRIESILVSLPENSLTIIVTDLFEDESDLGALFESFKDSVFRRHLAMGIVAMRAGFDGTIYDIGIEKGSRRWDGERPFYAVAIGKKPDVRAYFSEISHGTLPPDRLLIMSDDLLQRRVAWNSARRERTVGVTEDRGYIPVQGDPTQFGVIRMQPVSGKCQLELRLDTTPSPFHPEIDWSRIDVQLTVKRFPRNGGKAEDFAFGELLGASVSSARPNTPTILNLMWYPDRMTPKGLVHVERVHMQLGSESIKFSNHPFVQQWSATPVARAAGKFDGGKTQYLNEFVTGLWKSLVQVEHPDLGSIYIYFQP
jgi:hypothetical protein